MFVNCSKSRDRIHDTKNNHGLLNPRLFKLSMDYSAIESKVRELSNSHCYIGCFSRMRRELVKRDLVVVIESEAPTPTVSIQLRGPTEIRIQEIGNKHIHKASPHGIVRK